MDRESLPLAPVELLIANRASQSIDDIRREIENDPELILAVKLVRQLQEQEIYRRLSEGTMREAVALLFLKNVCQIDDGDLNALDNLLYGDGSESSDT
jgi:hypothetical protein